MGREDTTPLSRRELLGGAATLAGAVAVGAGGTTAALADNETKSIRVTAGTWDCSTDSGKVEGDGVFTPATVGGTHAFNSGAYQIRITAVDNKDGGDETVGVRFALENLDGTPGPAVTKVEVKGGGGPARSAGGSTAYNTYAIDPATDDITAADVPDDDYLYAPTKNGTRTAISHLIVHYETCTG